MLSRNPSPRRGQRLLSSAILTTGIISLMQQQPARAAAYIKTNTGSDTWSTATWSPLPPAPGYPNAAGDSVDFANTTAATNVTDLNVSVTLGQLTRTSTRAWTISTSNSSNLTLDNTVGSATNAFGGSLAAITTSGTSNNTAALTFNPNINIGNSGSVASPGLLIGVFGTGAIATPGPITIGGTITGTGAVYIASGSNGTSVVTSAITLSGLVNNTGLVNAGQFQAGSVVQNGTSTISFVGGIGSNVTGFSQVGSNNINISGAIAAFTGDITFNGTGSSTVTSNAGGTLSNFGTVSNIGNTSGVTNLVGVIGSNVSSVIQNSSNSQLTLSGANLFGNLFVKGGTAVTGNASGFGAGAVTLGDAAGTSATLLLNNGGAIVPNAINVAANANGTLTLAGSSTSNPAFTGPINNNGITINVDERTTGTLTLSGIISGSGGLTVVSSGVGTVGVILSGTNANTYSGLTTVQSGILTISKTAGKVAFAGNLNQTGGLVHPTTNNTIPSTATITVTGGIFNSNSATNANGGTSTDQTFTNLAVSGTGIFNGGASAATNGMTVTGNASFTGGSGAAFYGNAGIFFQAGSLTVNDMTKQTAPFVNLTAPTPAEVANSFTIGGNSTARAGKVTVGSGGLSLGATQAGGNYLLLRVGTTTAGTRGSLLALDGDVVTTGNAASSINVDVAASNGNTAGTVAITTTGIQLSATGTGAIVRNFTVAGGGADLNINAPIFNGTAFANGINKLGAGTLNLDRVSGSSTVASSFTGTTTVSAGTLRASAAGVLNNTSAITVNSTGSLLLGHSQFGGATTTDRVNNTAPISVNSGGKLGVADATSSLTENMGKLTLSPGAFLDFSTGNDNRLQFSDLTSVAGLSFTIANWSGSLYLTSDSADSGLLNQDRFLFAAVSNPGYTDAQLSGIVFYDDNNVILGTGHQVLFSAGVYEIVPVAIPEPTVLGFLAAAALAGCSQRRRSRKQLRS